MTDKEATPIKIKANRVIPMRANPLSGHIDEPMGTPISLDDGQSMQFSVRGDRPCIVMIEKAFIDGPRVESSSIDVAIIHPSGKENTSPIYPIDGSLSRKIFSTKDIPREFLHGGADFIFEARCSDGQVFSITAVEL